MKKIALLTSFLILSLSTYSQIDPNIFVGLNSPAYGVKIQTNWPGGTSGWARGFSIVNENDTESFFTLGAYGQITNGVTSLNYGYIGKAYNNITMAFLPNKNVGVGLTNPTARLHVNGDFRMQMAEGFRLYGDANYFGTHLDGIVFQMEDGNAINGSTDGGFVFRGYTPTDGLAKEWMVIKTGGKVGIGTSNPSEKLQIENASSAKIKLHTTSSTSNSGIIFSGKRPTSSVNSTHYIGTTGDGNYSLAIEADEATFFKTNDVTRMMIRHDGNIGIGNTNPLQALSINKSINASYSTTNPDEFGGASDMLSLYNGSSASNVYTSLYFRSNGNAGNSAGRMVLVNETSGEGSFAFQLRDGSHTGETREKMRLTSDGNLGIGINPIQALSVAKSINTSYSTVNPEEFGGASDIMSLHNKGTSIADLYTSLYFANDGNGGGATGRIVLVNETSGDGSFAFQLRDNTHTGETREKMRLTSEGNLGIGTINPDSKLAVNGIIHSKEVKVDLIGWPDYVFKKDYKLLSVEEVENYIKKHGHLPKMPSAKEVEENGVMLGEMNKKLLEKIEELTLYTIAQEKNLKKKEQSDQVLEKRVRQLEQENQQLKDVLLRLDKLEAAQNKKE